MLQICDRYIKGKREVHNARMEERLESDIEYNEEMLKETLRMLKKKSGKKYQFILKSGSSLINALNKLYSVVWKTEKTPEAWRETLIVQAWKGKGDKADLSNIRHLHLKQDIQKVFSHMVTNLIKPIIVKKHLTIPNWGHPWTPIPRTSFHAEKCCSNVGR